MTLRNNRKESSGYKVKLQNWTKVISLSFGILHFYIENCKWNIGTIPILVLESQFPNPTHSPTLTASPTPFPLFYEEPRAEGWRAWGPILPPGLCVRHRCSRIEIAGPVFLWLDLGLCDFLQWQRTEWRVMLEISGRGFLLHSQMDLEDHSTTPTKHFRNIRNDPMLWCENNKKSALARFSRNDPVIHETQWNPINRPLKLTYPCHPQQPQRLLWGQISHLTIFGTTILFDHHMFATMYC